MWKICALLFMINCFAQAKDVQSQRFKFIASIKKDNQHICTGSILVKNLILTTAHCVHNLKPGSLTVNVGSIDLSVKTESYQVNEIHLAPGYSYPKFKNAAALLQLNRPILYTRTVQPVSFTDKTISQGEILEADGWKILGKDKNANNILQYKLVTYISKKECGNILKTSIDYSVFCAKNRAEFDTDDEYFSDIGGPVLYYETLVGVIISTNRPSESSSPDVYVQLNNLIEWMNEIIYKTRQS